MTAQHEFIHALSEDSEHETDFTQLFNDINAYIGKRIRFVRMLRGMTLLDVSSQTGFSTQHIQKLEMGKQKIYPPQLVVFANALKVSPGYFSQGISVERGELLESVSNVETSLRPNLERLVQAFVKANDAQSEAFLSVAKAVNPRQPYKEEYNTDHSSTLEGDKSKIDAMYVRIGKRIEQKRRCMDMTQGQVSVQIGKTFQTFAKYEGAVNKISAAHLWLVSQVLGASIEHFYNGLSGLKSSANDNFPSFDFLSNEQLASKDGIATLIRHFETASEDQQDRLLNAVHVFAPDLAL